MKDDISRHYSIENNHLHFEGVDLVRLAETYGTPLFVFSEARIKENILEVVNAFKKYFKNFKIHYAVKANSNLSILRIVREMGLEVEIVSIGELYKVLKAGFKPENVVFNGPGKSFEELKEAVSKSLKCVNVDSEYELEVLAKTASTLGRDVKIAVRSVPEVKSYFKTAVSNSKFGVEKCKIIEFYKKAFEKPHIKPVGLHVHLGSQLVNVKTWSEGGRVLTDLLALIEEELNVKLEHINFGGGIPVDYTYTPVDLDVNLPGAFKPKISTDEIAETLWNSIKKVSHELEVWIEPGRKIVADSGVLLSKIVNFKERSSGEKWIVLDAGFNILPSILNYKWYYPLVNASKADKLHTSNFRVGGPLCDGHDVYFDLEGEEVENPKLPKYRRLPEDTKPGDYIAILHTGAYTLDASSNYNGRVRPLALLIAESGEVRVMRRRESLEDLVRLEL